MTSRTVYIAPYKHSFCDITAFFNENVLTSVLVIPKPNYNALPNNNIDTLMFDFLKRIRNQPRFSENLRHSKPSFH